MYTIIKMNLIEETIVFSLVVLIIGTVPFVTATAQAYPFRQSNGWIRPFFNDFFSQHFQACFPFCNSPHFVIPPQPTLVQPQLPVITPPSIIITPPIIQPPTPPAIVQSQPPIITPPVILPPFNDAGNGIVINGASSIQNTTNADNLVISPES
jgi:hypothetical protein